MWLVWNLDFLKKNPNLNWWNLYLDISRVLLYQNIVFFSSCFSKLSVLIYSWIWIPDQTVSVIIIHHLSKKIWFSVFLSSEKMFVFFPGIYIKDVWVEFSSIRMFNKRLVLCSDYIGKIFTPFWKWNCLHYTG